MSGTTSTRRALISASGAGAALALVLSGRSGNAAQAFPEGQIPWAKRFFNLYANAEGVAEMRELPLPHPGAQPPYQLIRHPAARVTVGSIAPGFMYDWHVANQPNILIPIFGTLVVELRDGSHYEFGHGDVLFAEDCVGSGHRSGAGPEGQFGVSVQLDKSLCPAPGESNVDRLLPA
ncbi:MAG: hypothetical protein F4013_00135 [Gammaproteobacteria bacterium]|nr:hypothetical protein [Gammaproteobacteria bacterium]